MATLLPQAEQTFFDLNGDPLAGGLVYFYTPGTTTPKDTFQDPGATIKNQNPVVLDSAGRAIIYGVGSYRQVVKDALANVIWDQTTADTSSAGASWAGTATGSANVIALAAPNFGSVDGQAIDFIAGFDNTGVSYALVNGTAIPIRLDTVLGPAVTPPGAVKTGNRYRVTYDATAGLFHLSPVVDRGYVDTGDAASLAAIGSAQVAAQAYAAAVAGQAQTAAITAAQADATNKANAAQAAAQAYAAQQAAQALSNAQSFATNADATVTANCNNYATQQASTAQSNAQSYAASAAANALSQAKGYSDSQLSAAQSNNASTYSQGVRLSGTYNAAPAGRLPGSVCVSAGGSTSNYAYLQYNINGTWRTAVDA